MLYVKGNLEPIAIDYDNVYSKCPNCGKLHVIDLVETLDITGDEQASVFCESCTKEREQEREISKDEDVQCGFCRNREEIVPGTCACDKSGVLILIKDKKTDHYYHCEGENFEFMKVED